MSPENFEPTIPQGQSILLFEKQRVQNNLVEIVYPRRGSACAVAYSAISRSASRNRARISFEFIAAEKLRPQKC